LQRDQKVKRYEQFVSTMGKLRKEFVAALAGVGEDVRDDLAERIQPASFLTILARLSALYACLMHVAVHEL
jgi:hypothetical protein